MVLHLLDFRGDRKAYEVIGGPRIPYEDLGKPRKPYDTL